MGGWKQRQKRRVLSSCDSTERRPSASSVGGRRHLRLERKKWSTNICPSEKSIYWDWCNRYLFVECTSKLIQIEISIYSRNFEKRMVMGYLSGDFQDFFGKKLANFQKMHVPIKAIRHQKRREVRFSQTTDITLPSVSPDSKHFSFVNWYFGISESVWLLWL